MHFPCKKLQSTADKFNFLPLLHVVFMQCVFPTYGNKRTKVSLHSLFCKPNPNVTVPMKLCKHILGLSITTILLTQSVVAQPQLYRYLRVGVGLGATNYLGDLDDDFTFKYTQPGISLTAATRVTPHISVRAGYFQGRMQATDANSINASRQRRNLSFRSPLSELSLQLQVDFVPAMRRYNYRPRTTPYIFGGVSVFTFNPQAKLNGRWVDLQPLGTEGQYLPTRVNPLTNVPYPAPYSRTQIAIPLGVGFRMRLSKRMDMEIESGFRKTFTDYLDDVSGRYAYKPDMLSYNPTAAYMMDPPSKNYPNGVWDINGIRGRSTQDDWYIYTCFTLSYIVDRIRCPKF